MVIFQTGAYPDFISLKVKRFVRRYVEKFYELWHSAVLRETPGSPNTASAVRDGYAVVDVFVHHRGKFEFVVFSCAAVPSHELMEINILVFPLCKAAHLSPYVRSRLQSW